MRSYELLWIPDHDGEDGESASFEQHANRDRPCAIPSCCFGKSPPLEPGGLDTAFWGGAPVRDFLRSHVGGSVGGEGGVV